MEAVAYPVYRVEIARRDVTADISRYVERVTYVDYDHGRADEISLDIANVERLWLHAWYPTKGDEIALWIGYDGGAMLPCGSFQIDDIEVSGPPDMIRLSGISAAVTGSLREVRSEAYENITLRQIAERIAERHGLELIGDVAPIQINRITQDEERDLAFLRRVAEDYGYAFKVTGAALVFVPFDELDGADSVKVLRRRHVSRYRLRDKSHELYRACKVTYFDDETGEVVEHVVDADGIVNGDVLVLNERAEDEQQAEEKARAALARANRLEVTGTLELMGDPSLMAGVNIELSGWGVLDRRYHIASSTHVLDKRSEGYTTSLEVRLCFDSES